jgi:hypothetical protein
MAGAIAEPVDGELELRTCRKCGETKKLDEFVRDGGKRLHTCRACHNRRRVEEAQRLREAGDLRYSSVERERLAQTARALGWDLERSAPDPAPVKLLHELLRDSRRAGMDFAAAWTEDVESALADVRPAGHRRSWREALEDTRDAWRLAYERADGALALTPALLDGPAHDAVDLSVA